ncbi:hypothetical protein NL676_002683 [Syzygium grande]|nr:hypothetical protein NL676_002683 [Syzygium grande]
MGCVVSRRKTLTPPPFPPSCPHTPHRSQGAPGFADRRRLLQRKDLNREAAVEEEEEEEEGSDAVQRERWAVIELGSLLVGNLTAS